MASCCSSASACWLVANFVASPDQFVNSLLYGVGNGALYALIALGYTLVYGIIELINFAHGDLFMLASVFSGFMMVHWLGAVEPSAASWAMMLLTLVAAMAFGATINVVIERVAYRRLRRAPKLASLITAVGMSFILQWVGLKLERLGAAAVAHGRSPRAGSRSAASRSSTRRSWWSPSRSRSCCC